MTALGTMADGMDLDLDLEALVGSHLVVAANSGGGKSGAIRKLLETTYGRVQHIILDAEDEFYTLRERFDYVIAGGDGADAPATLANAAGLATSALEHDFSLVAQINDLGDDAPAFIATFLDALIAAPQRLWRPLLVVIDEAQRFAPSGASSEATRAIKALLQRGRKRGFTAILASTRVSELHPGVRGLANNWMLGLVGQALDRRTAADQLGFGQSSAEARGLQSLERRQFWGFGPAISRQPVLFRVGDVETTPIRPGQAKVVTPPAPEALRAILAGLAKPLITAPSSEGQEIKREPFTDDIQPVSLEAELNRLRAERDDWTVESAHVQQQLDALVAENAALRECADRIAEAARDMALIRPAFSAIPAQGGGGPEVDEGQTEGRQVMMSATPRATAPASAARTATEKAGGGNASPAALPPRRVRILDAIAWGCDFLRRSTVERDIVAWIADTSPKSSTYANDLGALRTAGLVDYPAPGMLALTGDGLTIATAPNAPTTNATLWAAIAAKLPPRQVKIVDAVFAQSPRDRAEIANECGTTASSSTFANDLGRLRTLGLIDYPAPGAVGLGRVWR